MNKTIMVYVPKMNEFVHISHGCKENLHDYITYRYSGDPEKPFEEVDGGEAERNETDDRSVIELVLDTAYGEAPDYVAIPNPQ